MGSFTIVCSIFMVAQRGCPKRIAFVKGSPGERRGFAGGYIVGVGNTDLRLNLSYSERGSVPPGWPEKERET
jgi:hypothetical protein